MRFEIHFNSNILFGILLATFLPYKEVIVVVLSHFMPSIGYFFYKKGFFKSPRKQFFHSLFAGIILIAIIYYTFSLTVTLLCSLNLIYHYVLDLKGLAPFYPLSEYEIKFKGYSKRVEDAYGNLILALIFISLIVIFMI